MAPIAVDTIQQPWDRQSQLTESRPTSSSDAPLQDHDPELHGVPIQPAEALEEHPPVDFGTDGDLDRFVFRFRVPRDYTRPMSEDNCYKLHAEVLRKKEDSTTTTTTIKTTTAAFKLKQLEARQFFVYLCGGPGDGQQPLRHGLLNKYVVANGYQMLLLDYRGCGRSERLTSETLLRRRREAARDGDTDGAVRAFQEARQGNIVRDLEAVRRYFVQTTPSGGGGEGLGKFVLCGQSYGGWIALTYIDRYPSSVAAVLLTGGMPPMNATAAQVYERLFRSVARENKRFYEQHPDAREKVGSLAAAILETTSQSPRRRRQDHHHKHARDRGGNRLSLTTFASMGRVLGESDGARKLYERILRLERTLAGRTRWTEGEVARLFAEGGALVDTHRFNSRLPYAVDHEMQCYVVDKGRTSDWAARRVRDEGRLRRKFAWVHSTSAKELRQRQQQEHHQQRHQPRQHQRRQHQHQHLHQNKTQHHQQQQGAAADRDFYFLGEAFMPEHAEDYAELRRVGGKAFVERVIQAGQNETLFDRRRLKKNKVPLFAVIYPADMYVDAGLAVDAAKSIGGAAWKRLEDGSELRHNAIRERAGDVVRIWRELGFRGLDKDPDVVSGGL